jgi:RNA polymerase sigma-70 factor, ECF subfamily
MTTLVSTPPEPADAIDGGPARTDPDADLVEALREGRSDAAEALLIGFGPRAYRLAARITGNAHDAEEVTQDALWRVLDKIHTFRGESAFVHWVHRITANVAYQKLRGRYHQRHEVSWEELVPRFNELGEHAVAITDWSPLVGDPAIRAELRAELRRAIGRLPPECRTVVVMRDVEGMSNAEVAEALGMSVLAVKSRLHRARLFLRECLARLYAADLCRGPTGVSPLRRQGVKARRTDRVTGRGRRARSPEGATS